MRVQGNHWAGTEPMPDDEVGGADHAMRAGDIVRHFMAFNGEAETFQQQCGGFGMGGAIAGRVVGWHADEGGKKRLAFRGAGSD
jgi:hypothetical protein